jgi:hypothetical protein
VKTYSETSNVGDKRIRAYHSKNWDAANVTSRFTWWLYYRINDTNSNDQPILKEGKLFIFLLKEHK